MQLDKYGTYTGETEENLCSYESSTIKSGT